MASPKRPLYTCGMAVPAADFKEYVAATQEGAWVDLSGRSALRVTGPDRVTFLHGMVTNDINGLAEGASCAVAMLTSKGAMVGDGRVVKLADELVLDTGPGQGEAVRAFLEKYLISEEAEIHDAADLAVVGLLGPHAEALRTACVPAAATVAVLPSLVSERGLDVVIRRDQLDVVRAALAAKAVPEVHAATYDVLRVEAGAPRFGVDMTETTIPLEANLERAIHYNKGCYIGQEVIARATYRGQMNKKLVGLLLGEHPLDAGAELFKADKRVGRVTSVVRSEKAKQFIALAYVHRDHLAPGTVLERAAQAGQVTVSALPF